MPAVRWGLAAKLFATLILLGAVAILVTGVLGYVRARDSLEAAILNQLTAARQTKARQVETYFHTIRGELRVLAASKMVIDATRGFHDAVGELGDKPVPDEMRRKVDEWYERTYMPVVRRLLGADAATADYLPRTAAAVALQYNYGARRRLTPKSTSVASMRSSTGCRSSCASASTAARWSRA